MHGAAPSALCIRNTTMREEIEFTILIFIVLAVGVDGALPYITG